MNSPQPNPISPAKAEFLARQAARSSFEAWCRQAGFKPAKHHLLLINELQQLVDKLVATLNNLTPEQRESEVDGLRLMVLMPPGSAKSTYISKLFPPWFLAQVHRIPTSIPEFGILACSHEAGLATDFGRAARNLVEGNERWLGYTLARDSRAAEQWSTSMNSYYKAAGVGAGIAGRRMHLGLIDDFCGSQEDSVSKTFNNKVWDWYVNDFVVRLQPFAARVIIANHRNEDDLVGRLLVKEPTKWRVIRLRLLIENEEQAVDDPLGRKVGDYLWPEYFTRQQVEERMANVHASGIEQQEPSPLEGNLFKAEWFDNNTYGSLAALPTKEHSSLYGSSDHAVSTKQAADPSCFVIGHFHNGKIWIHPDLAWDKLDSMKAVAAMLRMIKEHRPVYWWAEKGHISKSIGPFLQEQMTAQRVYANIVEVTPVKDKVTRAQTLIGMMAMGLVKWPSFASWYQRLRREFLMFPNGKHDDAVDAVAHLANGINSMGASKPRVPIMTEDINKPWVPTLRWVKDTAKAKDRLRIAALRD